MALSWGKYRNLEKSLKYFLTTQISTDQIKDNGGTLIPVRVGRRESLDWTIPCISVYYESETAPRLFIGENTRDDQQLMIIDIYAENEGQRLDLAKWVTDTINNGWRYYTYVVNPSTPETPTKTAGGWVSLDFVTNMRVKLGENVDPSDAHRHRISIRVWI